MSASNAHLWQGKSWRIPTSDVSSELMGHEVVAIHLPTGIYYSLEHVAATIWSGIERGATFEQLVQTLTATYDVTPEVAETDAAGLLAELLKEQLIVEATGSGEVIPPTSGDRLPYVAPKLEKFADLQDLLLIDPIHEVDKRGWPHVKSP